MEHKNVIAHEVKMDATGAGTMTSYDSVFYVLDDGGDIVMPGAYKDSLPRFLKRGFGSKDHNWSYDGAISYPTAAIEDAYGLKTTFAFHSTPDAQVVRTKAQERADAGMDVFKSIGYETMAADVIYPAQYEERLKAALPAQFAQAALDKAKADNVQKIRLLKNLELYECATVVVPMLKDAVMTGIKTGETETNLGSFTVGSVVYTPVTATDMGTVTASTTGLKTVTMGAETNVEEYADGTAEMELEPALQMVLKAAQRVVDHAESRKEIRIKQGRRLSASTVDSLRALRAQLDSLLDEPTVEESPVTPSETAGEDAPKSVDVEDIQRQMAIAQAELELMKMRD